MHAGATLRGMATPIPIQLEPASRDPADEIEIEAALVAPGLGLDVDAFQRLMSQRKITQLCERGIGEDAGLYRATFYYGDKRVRLVVDDHGTPVQDSSD